MSAICTTAACSPDRGPNGRSRSCESSVQPSERMRATAGSGAVQPAGGRPQIALLTREVGRVFDCDLDDPFSRWAIDACIPDRYMLQDWHTSQEVRHEKRHTVGLADKASHETMAACV